MRTAAFIAIWCACLAAEAAETWMGLCVRVMDGDTICVKRDDGRTVKIRLVGIDCPELAQPFGDAAKELTSRLALGRTVRVEPAGRGRYGRLLAWVYAGDVCLNRELLRAGLAWWDRRNVKKQLDLGILEAQAFDHQVGLWSDPRSISPREFRRQIPKSGTGGGKSRTPVSVDDR